MYLVQLGSFLHSTIKLHQTKMLLVSSAKIIKCCLFLYDHDNFLLYPTLLYFVLILYVH